MTGAASGIGAEAARIFVKNGAFIDIADVKDELGHQVGSSTSLNKVSYHAPLRRER